MIEQLVATFKSLCLKHKGVKTFKYQGADLINAQNNNEYIQCVLDDVHLSQHLIGKNVNTVTLDLYILDFVKTNDLQSHIKAQDKCYSIAVDIITMLDNSSEYNAYMSVHDWSILTLSRYTSDNDCGTKLTIELYLALDTCDYEDNFNEEEYVPEISIDDKTITLTGSDKDDSTITLRPIKIRQ